MNVNQYCFAEKTIHKKKNGKKKELERAKTLILIRKAIVAESIELAKDSLKHLVENDDFSMKMNCAGWTNERIKETLAQDVAHNMIRLKEAENELFEIQSNLVA